MTDDQITNYYLLGCIVHIIYVAIRVCTKKKGQDQIRFKVAVQRMKDEGIMYMWPMFIFITVLTIVFWPLSLLNKVIDVLRGKAK